MQILHVNLFKIYSLLEFIHLKTTKFLDISRHPWKGYKVPVAVPEPKRKFNNDVPLKLSEDFNINANLSVKASNFLTNTLDLNKHPRFPSQNLSQMVT